MPRVWALVIVCVMTGCGGPDPATAVPPASRAEVSIPEVAVSEPATAPHVFAFEREPGEVVQRDIDGDGSLDVIAKSGDGGSGYTSSRICVGNRATRRWSCVTQHHTAYSPFSAASRKSSQPAPSAEILAALPTPACMKPRRESPAQAALWVLPRAEDTVIALNALPLEGKPVRQRAVCLDPHTALELPGGFSWEPSGSDEERTPLMNDPDLQIVYQPGAGDAADQVNRTSLHVALETQGHQVFVQGAAVAVYSVARDRHAWIANYADGSDEGFKIDRHSRFRAIEATQRGFAVHLEGSGRRIDIELPRER